MNEVNKRNFKALSEGLKTQRSQISNIELEMKRYNEMTAQLQKQVQDLASKVGFLTAKTQGGGSYVY
jgi:predicted  nucleic acid-binding Zn-ribbon protein